MNLDEFADYKVSAGDRTYLYLRHQNCPKRWIEQVDLNGPIQETNLKWLMVLATNHWQEVHRSES